MISKIKQYLIDAVEGNLEEPVATMTSGGPVGNFNQVDMQNIKEMKKKFKLKDAPKKNRSAAYDEKQNMKTATKMQ